MSFQITGSDPKIGICWTIELCLQMHIIHLGMEKGATATGVYFPRLARDAPVVERRELTDTGRGLTNGYMHVEENLKSVTSQ